MILNNEPNRCNLDKGLCKEEEGEECKDKVPTLLEQIENTYGDLKRELEEMENGYSTKES